VYNHCNICNISIYFCNIHMKHLQHTSEISETPYTKACNLRFQAQHLLVAWKKMEARRCRTRCRRGARHYGVCGGRWCGARRQHGPWHGLRQVDGARPQWEAESGWGHTARARVGSVSWAGACSAQSERAKRTGAVWARSVPQAGDAGGVRPDGRTQYYEHYRKDKGFPHISTKTLDQSLSLHALLFGPKSNRLAPTSHKKWEKRRA
jgi:hypothetical protein